MRPAWFLSSLVCLVLGCAHSTAASDAPPAASASTPTEPPAVPGDESRAGGKVIGTFVTHDAKVSVLSSEGSGELRVVLRKSDGQLVADGIPLSELEARDPLLHEIVTSAVASNRRGTYLDATLVPPPSTRR